MPHKNGCHKVTKGLSLSLHMSIHTYCTLFSLLINFTCFTIFCLCGNSFLQSWGPGPLSLTPGWLARIWFFPAVTWHQSLSGNPSPCSSHCRPGYPKSNWANRSLAKGRPRIWNIKGWGWRTWSNIRCGVFSLNWLSGNSKEGLRRPGVEAGREGLQGTLVTFDKGPSLSEGLLY